ncbi:MAG: helix-turn-helix domain-containing protein [Actinomycetota bacterium]|nr:helix-turn-helix domain-containing protein [Actinomycetota bacterium]
MRLARDIRRYRAAAGLSQPQLAGKIGYTRQYVSLAERPGKNLPSRELVTALDAALEADGALLARREQAKAEQQVLRRGVTADVAAPSLANRVSGGSRPTTPTDSSISSASRSRLTKLGSPRSR